MTGTDKCQLLIIGKSKDPHCFRGVKNLPVIYKNNKNSWLTGEIFTHWLKDLNKDMRRQKRNVLLLVDNCSAHPPSSADSLTNVRLKFFPPNTTSIIQPCDQGIIRNLKSYYCTQIVRRLISDIDSPETTATDYAKKLTLLDAVHLLSTAWKNVKQQTIVNCYRKAGFQIPTVESQNAVTDDDLVIPTIIPQIDFDRYVNHYSDTPCHGLLTDEEIAHSLRELPTDPQEDSDNKDEHEENQLLVTATHVYNCLQDLRRVLEERGKVKPDTDFSNFYALERQIHETFKQTRRQTKVTEFIEWIPYELTLIFCGLKRLC